jgi:hypothetical protein
MRIACKCYDIYKNRKSFRSYEMEIVKAGTNGSDCGDLSHSMHFADKFRPFVSKKNQETDCPVSYLQNDSNRVFARH